MQPSTLLLLRIHDFEQDILVNVKPRWTFVVAPTRMQTAGSSWQRLDLAFYFWGHDRKFPCFYASTLDSGILQAFPLTATSSSLRNSRHLTFCIFSLNKPDAEDSEKHWKSLQKQIYQLHNTDSICKITLNASHIESSAVFCQCCSSHFLKLVHAM